MLLHVLAHLAQLFGGYAEERNMARHDQQVTKNRHRRRTAHFDVPALEIIEQRHGPRFTELIDMLVATDPARLHTRATRREQDHEHLGMMRRRYKMMAWTLIHRLAKEDASPHTGRILARELSLWFGENVQDLDHLDPKGLVAQLARWRSRWDFS